MDMGIIVLRDNCFPNIYQIIWPLFYAKDSLKNLKKSGLSNVDPGVIHPTTFVSSYRMVNLKWGLNLR